MKTMQVSISIEPYLKESKTNLTRYIETIIQLNQKLNGKVCLHFDYFQPNTEIFQLVQNYTDKIDVDLHLMQEPAPSIIGFRSISCDLSQNLSDVDLFRRGLVLDLGCDFYEYAEKIQTVRYVIIITVKCGKSGQAFQASALQLIEKVKQVNPRAVIIIDGGVNENNVDLLKKQGVDVVVVGSYAKKSYENGNFLININRLLHK
ncbi:MAG: hypothetical protein MJ054_01435 [Clostridia bacterium]|nr:hypothetical protein [Clostridia bacterium]